VSWTTTISTETQRDGARAERLLGDPLLDAAVSCLEEGGFRGTTIERVAMRVGMPTGDILRRFPSVEHLAVAVLERVLNHLPEEVTHASVPGSALGDRLYALLATEVRLLTPYKKVVRSAVLDALNPLSPSALLQAPLAMRYLSLVAGQIQEAKAKDEVSWWVNPLMAAGLFAALRATLVWEWLSDGSSGSKETPARARPAITAFVRGLAPFNRVSGPAETVAPRLEESKRQISVREPEPAVATLAEAEPARPQGAAARSAELPAPGQRAGRSPKRSRAAKTKPPKTASSTANRKKRPRRKPARR
jgi:AcrR family transcriptional regulator